MIELHTGQTLCFLKGMVTTHRPPVKKIMIQNIAPYFLFNVTEFLHIGQIIFFIRIAPFKLEYHMIYYIGNIKNYYP
ncbi:hypothetical protein [Clostridium phage CP3]|nr:hypothetical protein [Clostridium phage CP3]